MAETNTRGRPLPCEVSKTDLSKAIAYLEDAARLYEALGVAPAQKYVSRAHMIRRLAAKLKTRMK